MSKKYFGLTYQRGSKERTIIGVVANSHLKDARVASKEEQAELYQRIKGSASESLRDCLADGTYPNPIVVWDTRAEARASIRDLNSYESPHFTYSVLEVGDKTERKIKPIIGWRIISPRGEPSAYNGRDLGATVQLDPSIVYIAFANNLFPTRQAARHVVNNEIKSSQSYKVKAVYRA